MSSFTNGKSKHMNFFQEVKNVREQLNHAKSNAKGVRKVRLECTLLCGFPRDDGESSMHS
jgi:hypothetical protein